MSGNNWRNNNSNQGNSYPNNYRNSNSNSNSNDQRKKHSGAKNVTWKDSKNDSITVTGISAWNYSKSKGMVKVFIAPYNKSDVVHETKTGPNAGRKSVSMMCKVSYVNSGVEKHFPVMVDELSGKTVLPEMGWVVNPKAPNGGYCGTFTK